MKKIRVVTIGGFGHIDAVFRDLAVTQEAELVGMAPAYKGEDISKFFNLPPASGKNIICEDYCQMIKELKPDVAVVSTRLDLIPKLIMDAADAGCHIIAEKPLALDISMLEQVQNNIGKNKVNLMAMLTMRSDPQFVAAKQVYDSGAIGEAILVNARKSYKWGTRPDWFGDKNKYGGTIGWVGIHAFDFINYVTGLSFTKVAAMKGNLAHCDRIGCEDNCVLIAQLSNGGHAGISVDYCRPESAPTHGDDWIRVVGTKGVLEASLAKKNCAVISSEKGTFEQPLPDCKDKMFRRFLLNLLDGKSQDNHELKRLSFMLTKVCLLARQAAEENKVIEIN
ncbi:MAG: Inositol 2-dehydrogenase [Planctomycetes bacterium ADurb.Bin401]|nr:MAG: Inositol 2-dehydrogenase [Planctomycetes bacterium ADurb.Bin401]